MKNISATVYYVNVRGLTSKVHSVKDIIQRISPTIIVLCETMLNKSSNIIKEVFKEYEVVMKNVKRGKGGLAIAVSNKICGKPMDVTSSIHENVLAVRCQIGNTPVRIILGYSPQESESSEERETFYTEISIEINRCIEANDCPLVLGDWNARIENDEGIIEAKSSNGKLLKEVIEEYDLNVLNFSSLCKGKWTHEIRTNGNRSVIDYLIVDEKLNKCVKEVIIDEQCLFCPFRLLKKKNGDIKQIFTDHNAILISFKVHRKDNLNKIKKK